MSLIKENFDGEKYTVIFSTVNSPQVTFKAMRYGEEWRDLTGDGLVLAMLHEVEKLRKVVSEVHSWVVCAGIYTPDDMAKNFPRIIEITSPDFEA